MSGRGVRTRLGRLAGLGGIALIAAAVVAGPVLAVGVSLFVQVSGIPGESNTAGRVGTIVADGYSFAASRPLAGGSKLSFDELLITHGHDSASPLLLAAHTTGTPIAEVKIDVVKVGTTITMLLIKLSGVRVSSWRQGVSNARAVEQLGLRYDKIELTYTNFGTDGLPMPLPSTAYDLVTNVAK